jgi:hypothetical protein
MFLSVTPGFSRVFVSFEVVDVGNDGVGEFFPFAQLFCGLGVHVILLSVHGPLRCVFQGRYS